MVIVYDIYTQHIGNARQIAMKRAIAEGWSRSTVTAIHKVAPDTYEVTITVFK